MLRRMYLKWFDKKSFKYEIISEHKGEEAGIKSSTLKVNGEYLYGLMKRESGVHRLVRFLHLTVELEDILVLQVYGFIQIDDEINIEINEKDLRIDTYRSSGCRRTAC